MENISVRVILQGFVAAICLIFLRKIVLWLGRIRDVGRTMPVIPVLFPPASPVRFLWPKKWQTFHYDWNTQYRRTIYSKLGTDVFALISLFEYDKVFVCDPYAVAEMKFTESSRYPKDVRQFSQVSIIIIRTYSPDDSLWSKSGYY
jgi:hypothetical protein